MLDRAATHLRQHIEALIREYPELQDDEFLRQDMLEGSTDFREILIQLHRLVEDAKSLRDGTGQRLEELKARRDRFQRRMDFGRELMRKVLESANLKKMELPEATLSLRNNPPALLGEADPWQLPDELVAIKRTADKKKIREAIENGQHVEGYTLSNAAPSLMVRVK